MVCRHCHEAKVNRPRGLCWSCYYRPGVRDQYQSTSKFGRRYIPVEQASDALGLPTGAMPGSAEKLLVLAERASVEGPLWHPDDATFEQLNQQQGFARHVESIDRIG